MKKQNSRQIDGGQCLSGRVSFGHATSGREHDKKKIKTNNKENDGR